MRSLVFAFATLSLPAAVACSVIVGAAYSPSWWHRITDFSAPTTPVVTGPPAVQRGIGPSVSPDGRVASTSCDDLGFASLTVRPSTDRRTDRGRIGYAFEVVGGEAPRGLLPEKPVTLPGRLDAPEADLPLVWVDGATNEQEAFEVRVVIRAIDRAGNRSAPSDTVRIAHPGYAPGEARRDASGRPLG